MVDATPLYPDGFHPVLLHRERTAQRRAAPLRRECTPVRYYFVGFDLSLYLEEPFIISERTVLCPEKKVQDVPEVSYEVPYNPFKADLYMMGKVIQAQRDVSHGLPPFTLC